MGVPATQEQSNLDDSVIGYTVTLMKDDTVNKAISVVGLSEQQKLYEIRVHMKLDQTIKYFETSQCTFEIEKITAFNEKEKKIHLKVKEAYGKSSWAAPKDRWLYFDDTAKSCGSKESKRFLFFLIEHYMFGGSNIDLFDTSSVAGIKAWLPNQDFEVKEWITADEPTYGLTNAALATNFKLTCQITEKCVTCDGLGAISGRCKCKGGNLSLKKLSQYRCEGMTEEQKTNLPFGCPKELRCDKCTCQACRAEGVVAILHIDCPDGPCKVHCTDCEGYGTIPAEESDEDSEECATCKGDGKYQEPEPEPEKPKCKCSATLPEPTDGKPAKFCAVCGAKQPPPPRTECSKADCGKPLTMQSDGTPPKFCGECGTPTCNKCWGFCKSLPCNVAERRRIAEDNIQPLTALCAWILALTVGMSVFLLDRHAAGAKRDAMQRGQSHRGITNM